jgi:hypothetical protein
MTGPQINLVDFSSINVNSPKCFDLYHEGNKNEDISSEEHFENSKINM